jgi:hypothetical protein
VSISAIFQGILNGIRYLIRFGLPCSQAYEGNFSTSVQFDSGRCHIVEDKRCLLTSKHLPNTVTSTGPCGVMRSLDSLTQKVPYLLWHHRGSFWWVSNNLLPTISASVSFFCSACPSSSSQSAKLLHTRLLMRRNPLGTLGSVNR